MLFTSTYHHLFLPRPSFSMGLWPDVSNKVTFRCLTVMKQFNIYSAWHTWNSYSNTTEFDFLTVAVSTHRLSSAANALRFCQPFFWHLRSPTRHTPTSFSLLYPLYTGTSFHKQRNFYHQCNSVILRTSHNHAETRRKSSCILQNYGWSWARGSQKAPSTIPMGFMARSCEIETNHQKLGCESQQNCNIWYRWRLLGTFQQHPWTISFRRWKRLSSLQRRDYAEMGGPCKW